MLHEGSKSIDGVQMIVLLCASVCGWGHSSKESFVLNM